MARKTRIEFPGAIYHVLDRGDRREAIYGDDEDRRAFLTTLGEACQRTGWRIHAYVLMSNHFHLMLETPEPNLVEGMHWFQATWTMDHALQSAPPPLRACSPRPIQSGHRRSGSSGLFRRLERLHPPQPRAGENRQAA